MSESLADRLRDMLDNHRQVLSPESRRLIVDVIAELKSNNVSLQAIIDASVAGDLKLLAASHSGDSEIVSAVRCWAEQRP